MGQSLNFLEEFSLRALLGLSCRSRAKARAQIVLARHREAKLRGSLGLGAQAKEGRIEASVGQARGSVPEIECRKAAQIPDYWISVSSSILAPLEPNFLSWPRDIQAEDCRRVREPLEDEDAWREYFLRHSRGRR